MAALVLNESGLDPLAIGDNTSHRSYHPATRPDAERLATALIAQGHSIDMGISQINSRTAPRVGLSVGEAFDPCASIAAAGRLMVSTFRRVAPHAPSSQHALAATLSTYNTGDAVRGITNGYVARVYRAAARARGASAVTTASVSYQNLPQIARSESAVLATGEMPETPSPQPSWAVFGAAAPGVDVFATPRKDDK